MYHKTILGNGLRILTETMEHTRSVSICVFVGVGSRYESDAKAGISHFVEHVLFRGTEKRPASRDISEAIEGVGGVLNGGTDRESTVYWCKVPQQHFKMALEVLSDIMLHSRFAAEDIEKERQVIIEEINMGYDNPAQRVGQLIDAVMWPDHPLGRDIAGSKSSVSTIKRKDLLRYLKKCYLPVDTVISIAGNVTHREAISVASDMLGDWTGAEQRPNYKSHFEKSAPRLSVETRDIEQVHLCLALPGLSRVHPQRFVLDLLNIILGEGMSSRLFTEVRDQMGLAYSIYSFVEHLADSGALTVYAGIEPGRLIEAVKAISKQLARFTREIVSETELTKAREMAKGHLLLRLEDSRHVASWLGGQEVLSDRVRTVDEVVNILDAITAHDIQKLARQMIRKDRLRMAIVGPVKKSTRIEKFICE